MTDTEAGHVDNTTTPGSSSPVTLADQMKLVASFRVSIGYEITKILVDNLKSNGPSLWSTTLVVEDI